MTHGDAHAHKTTLSGQSREEFVRAFAPALLQVLRQSGQADVREEDVLASLTDPRSKIEFETPPATGGAVMVACVITDLNLVTGGHVEVIIRRKPR